MSMIRRLTKVETKQARAYANELIHRVHAEIKKMKNIKFSSRRVGSASNNTIVCDSNGCYDIDYQIVLSGNVDFSNPTVIRNKYFSESFKRAYKGSQCASIEPCQNVCIEDSKSVITVKVFKEKEHINLKYFIDFAIIGYAIINKSKDEKHGKSSIIRRAPQNLDQQLFTWNELPGCHNDAYNNYKNMSPADKTIVRDRVVERKIKLKKENDESYKSFAIFIEEVNRKRGELNV